MIEQLQLQKLWFAVNKYETEEDFDTNNALMNLSIWAGVIEINGYPSLADIPNKKLENKVLIQGYQFTFNNQPVSIEKSTKFEKYFHVFFASEEEALFFQQKIVDLMEENYWSDEEERLSLIALGYEFEEGEDFSEISINEDRRWHEHLNKWCLRDFDGLGYKIHFRNEIIDF